ncbi:sulfotransferase [Micromonospora echinofusca]|uniref:Sulfotransferase n=1 Tax=Micromonospora echinofusca TaxID=47858 RepID=A0ABS3VL96_MICEH|nr:sulfotransferase [Micromonospora echinofusca]MBO4205314.1 sulfotransferase [Micromonospora echinofusca]
MTVLYVCGMPRSGSTLLDLMLGQFVGHCDVGELFYLWQSGVERNFRCACGAHFDQCPFWAEVGQRAYGGWSSLDVADIRALQRRVDATARLPLILNPSMSAGFRRDLASYTDLLTRLYRAIADVSGARVVVDSTKRPSLAYILAQAPEIDLRMVHVLRDPRGVAYSWSQVVELPEGTSTKGRMNQRSARLTARRWVTVNTMISALARRGVPRVVVRYEDLVRDPRAELGRIAALTADVTGTVDPLDFLHGNEFTQAGSHAVAGGRIRMRSGPITLSLDEKWRREYAPARQRMVAALTWPLRTRYDYR